MDSENSPHSPPGQDRSSGAFATSEIDRAGAPMPAANEPDPAGSPREDEARENTDSGDAAPAPVSRRHRGMGLAWKIALLTLVPMFLLASVTAFFAYSKLHETLVLQAEQKGRVIATGLSGALVESLMLQDAATLQAHLDRTAQAPGVAYLLVTGEDARAVAHTFAPHLPDTLLQDSGELSHVPHRKEVSYLDPETSTVRRVIDIGEPVLTAERNRVRVGMDLDRIESSTREVALFVATIGALASLIALLAALIVARRTVSPIHELAAIAAQVGEGNLSQMVPVRTRDEIGVLAETMNDTILRLRDQVQTEEERDHERHQRVELQSQIAEFRAVASDISAGDLTRRGRVPDGVLGDVVESINRLASEIGELLGSVREAGDTVSAGSLDMIEKTQHMVAGAQAQARDAVKVSSQVGQASAAMRSVSESANASAEAARQTLAAAEHGQHSVELSLAGMKKVRQEVQTVARRVEGLAERGAEISEVVETLATIASQTNLLALNAAIEASGAGEAGARFAVVADEVRKLAEDSGRASKRVARLISSVQTEVADARAAMEVGTREVESGFQVAHTAGEQLREIADISGRSAELAEQISQAVTGQADGVERVSEAVRSIAEVAAETEASVLDGRRVADQLRQLADRLDQALARFKLA